MSKTDNENPEQSTINNQQSTIPNPWRRAVMIGVVAIVAVVLGHYGLRLTGNGLWPSVMDSRGGRAWRPERIPLPVDARLVGEEASASKSGHVFVQYLVQESPGAVETFFRAAMPDAGWKESQDVAAAPVAEDGRVLAYSNNKGNWCMIAVSEGMDGTVISVLRIRRLAVGQEGRGSFEKETSQ